MNLVLDMDQTLISSKNHIAYARPYLKEFLTFCFSNFKTVGIWTNANRNWFEAVNQSIFEPILAEIGARFHFVYTDERSSLKRTQLGNFYMVKRLKKLWRQSTQPHTKHNTIMIDDSSKAYEENYGNAIPISPWHHSRPGDKMLLAVAVYLQMLLAVFDHCGTIRYVEKRDWVWKIPAMGLHCIDV